MQARAVVQLMRKYVFKLYGRGALETLLTIVCSAAHEQLNRSAQWQHRPVASCAAGRTSPKTVLTPAGELKLNIAHDRQATFEPQWAGNQRRLPGWDEHVISIYARGMSGKILALRCALP